LLERQEVLISDQEMPLNKHLKVRTKIVKTLKDVCLGGEEKATTKMRSTLTPT
jgi:hypothetical protein